MRCVPAFIVLALGLADCWADSPLSPVEFEAVVADAADPTPHWSSWSEPVNVGAPVNGDRGEFNPALSPDGLSLYFNSPRPGGLGAGDIWVAHRDCRDCPWGPPANLGPAVNSASGEADAELSTDGHLLFFTSDRPGGLGGQDLYVSRRGDTRDDFAWESPTNLGPDVNTAAAEAGPAFLQERELYFSQGTGVGPSGTQGADIYAAPMTPLGEPRGAAVLVQELSSPTADEGGPTVRLDGLEIVFASHPADNTAGFDLWVSTRRSVHDAWSAPTNLGGPVNITPQSQFGPYLSHDGLTLLVHAGAARGGLGGFDLWAATRIRGAH